ncbi:UPF0606 protein KIAA1549L homolog isoform X4 [Alligator mississippiensis]|uniref:UPF0606 protein KIAA1549L homolog isoform X4 n=1 Tax=Alligator mississippiensis TaxID=8496 RepID=UPI00287810A1|nr:UPF0606 protein KIAA1549L homolog isoform X4 [Alligator mississippiensis]
MAAREEQGAGPARGQWRAGRCAEGPGAARLRRLLLLLLVLLPGARAQHGTKQQQINVAPSTKSLANWRSRLSPTWPSMDIKSSSVADISMGQTLENANLLQMIKTTLTGTRTRIMDQTNFSPALYQGSGNSASQEPAEVSAESPFRPSSQDADEKAAVSGLPQLSMFATLSTTPSVTHSSTAVPSQLISLDTPSISKESTPGSGIPSTVPSPSFSSSPHTIIFAKSTVLPTKVPLSTDTESSINRDSSSSHVSANRGNSRSVGTAVNPSTVNHTLSRKGPRLLTGTTSLNIFGSTMVHLTKTLARESPLESTAFLSLHTSAPLSVMLYPSSQPVASKSASWLPIRRTSLSHSRDDVSSSRENLSNQPFKAVVTDKENYSSLTVSPEIFKNKSEIYTNNTLFLHTMDFLHTLLKVTSHQSSSALTNDMLGSLRPVFLSPASVSPLGVSHSTENKSSFTMPKTFFTDALNTSNAVFPAPANESDFLVKNATLPYSTDTTTSLITKANQTSNITALIKNATNYENTLMFSLVNISLPHSTVSANEVFSKEVTHAPPEANAMLPTEFEPPQLSDVSSMRAAAYRSFTRDTVAKIYTNMEANRVVPHDSQYSRPPSESPASEHTTRTTMLERILQTESMSPLTPVTSLATSTAGFSKFIHAIIKTSALYNSKTSQVSSPNGQSLADLIDNEESNVEASTIVTPRTEYLHLPPLNKSEVTSGQFSNASYSNAFTPIVSSELYKLSPYVPVTETTFSKASTVSISTAVPENSLDTTKSPKASALASKWPLTALISSGSSTKETAKMAITEVIPSTSSLETDYRGIDSAISHLQQQINNIRSKQTTISLTSATYTSATSNHNSSFSPVVGIKTKNFTNFNLYSSALEMSTVQYSSPSPTMVIPAAQSEKHINTPQNVTKLFTSRDVNLTSKSETSVHVFVPAAKDFAANGMSTVSSMLSSDTANAEKVSSTNTLYSTPSELGLASQFTGNWAVSADNEIVISDTQPTISPSLVVKSSSSSALISSPITEEYMTPGNQRDFSNNSLSEPSSQLTTIVQNPTILVPVPNEVTEGAPLQTPTTSALQSVIITSVHESPTPLTSAFLSTTNFTHSVITVLSSVSPGAIPTVGTSEAKPFTGESAPTSPVPTSSLFSLGTENTPLPPVMALSTLISTLAKNNTATKMTSILNSVATHTGFPFAPRNISMSPPRTATIFLTSKVSRVPGSTLGSTTHTPRQIETTVPDTMKITSSEITKTSTPYPLTITAALTSITASAKTTRLPPTPVESTSAAPATSSAAFANTTAVPALECQQSRNLMVKTVLLLNTRRLLISGSLKENVTKGLTLVLRQAFNQNVNAQVEILEQSNNVTVGYYVTQGRLVFIPAAVIEMLIAYGVSNATADIKQHVPNLQSVAVLALPWNPLPAYHFQLKTELQFVGQTDNIQSCKFVQTMEQRLQRAFQDAERKVLNTSNNLTVQILNTSNISQGVTLFYVVSNQSTTLNGTVSSNLLNQLSAELVGFYLTYPPLTIAESLEYPNLDVSESTRDYWVITVIQGVDITLLGLNNQSFARLMEQRLAPLFMMSHQQGRRFKRATTVGSYTVQMVKMQRIPGPKEPAELTYYTLYNAKPLLGTAAAKILSTVDSQRMALTLGYVIQVQADPVVKNPPNNLWIIAAVLAPIAVVTVIIIIITAVLCRKNKNDFKPDTMMNLPQRAKPVQGFDYAKQHLGQQGAEDEVLPVTQETVVLPLPVRDAPASQEREITQDGSTIKTAKSNETRKSRSPSQNGSVITNESGKPSSGRSSPQKVMAQQKVTKDEGRKRNGFKSSKNIVPISDEEEGDILFDNSIAKSAIDPFDTSSGSVQLIAIKPMALPPVHAASDRSQESAIINGEVNKALKQKSDIEHYRNKLRLKAKRKGYYDFPQVDNNKGLTERRKLYEKPQKEIDHGLDPEIDVSSPFAEPKNRQQMKNSVYRSRQSLNSPSPGETEMDLLVTRERPRRGIRNSGYDAYRFSQLPEMIMGSPPPPVPPRTGPVAVASLRRSTSDIGSKTRISEASVTEQAQHHDPTSFAPSSRAPVSMGPLDQSALNYSGNTVPAVFAIPAANRTGFTGYFIPTPPTAYRNQAWMPYAGENELPGQWADSVPLPGYIEAYPRPRYPHNSPSRLHRQYSQPASMHPSLEQAPLPSTAASQQSLTENDPSDTPLTNISTAALVKAIREEVAKLAKKQTDMFEFQV